MSRGTLDEPVTTWLPGDPPNLDPQTGVDEWSYRVHVACFEGLTRPDRAGHPQPGLAREWHLDDSGTVVTIRLRPEARWSDGRPVSADDVVHGVERALDPAGGRRAAWQMFVIRGGEARHRGRAEPLAVRGLDRHTVEIRLAEPAPYLPELWLLPPFAPLRRDHPPGTEPGELAEAPVTGPFRLVSYRPGQHLRLARNREYWNRAAMPTSDLTIRIGGDPVAQFMARDIDLTPVGEVDLAGDAGAAIDPTVITRVGEAAILYLLLNATDPALADPALRAAVAAAIDPTELVQRVAPSCPPLHRLVPATPGNRRYLADQPNVRRPRTGNTSALAGVALTLLCGDLPQSMAEAQLVAEQLARAGAEVRLRPADYSARFWEIKRSEYQLALAAWQADFDDPVAFLREHVSNGVAGNQSKWDNRRYNELVAAARAEPGRARRHELLARAEQLLLDAHHLHPLLQRVRPWLIRPGLADVVFRSTGAALDLRWVTRR